ncbi:MAG TPA: biotin carboxylase N-terminal domain-containing protein, partial [Candidatus Polarisedimenticolia bacterium]|nr:biotin carboxylase N-terminal domain-containing protein [Candidatus Polarisedimenticolia bacterium]
MPARTITRLLIANRGEIAVRIAHACRALDVVPVAVVSEADRGALHSRVAAETVLIGPAPAAESYLRVDRLIAAARERRCEAIHPGYGFLSQSAEFAEAVEGAGLVFIGPPPAAMRLMGDKIAARRTMTGAGVPVVPGFEGTGDEAEPVFRKEADRIGYPILVKAAGGGGGRGMRVVRSPEGLGAALESARREAQRGFGDPRLFLEKAIEGAHHVEVQVLADGRGGCVHLFERDCSLQRRFQKIVEESPSPLVDDALRDEMGRAAVAAARACGYVNAGTIEFLVGPDLRPYFLEMNTRIQVEHPVTEMVTGIDLVQAQIRIASGEPLPVRQEDVVRRGHALECRVNAEDPGRGFMPSTGRLLLAAFPSGDGIRVDAGVATGDTVSPHYDALLAKIIVHAADRPASLNLMRETLAKTAILG